MNKLFPRDLDLPLLLLAIGVIVPLALFSYEPTNALFDQDIFYWAASFLYLSGALAATRLTFNRLLQLSPQADLATKISLDAMQNEQKKNSYLQMSTTSAQLLIMGVALLSLLSASSPISLASLTLYVSLRMGETLLVLGMIVLGFTHLKMRKL
jgi:hypothetical protein